MRCPECRFKLPTPLVEQRIVTCNNCLTKVNVHSKKVVNDAKPTYHHSDHYMRESTVTELEYTGRTSKPLKLNQLQCLLCHDRVDTLKTTEGSLLGMSTRTQKYTEYDFVNKVEVEFEKKVKFPTYKSGHICEDCLVAFTELCNTYDDWNNVKAKLKYVATTDSKLSDDLIMPISTSITYKDAVENIEEDTVVELTDLRRVTRLGMKFHRLSDIAAPDSPVEVAAKKARAARLRPVEQNVNHKFGKPERTRKR